MANRKKSVKKEESVIEKDILSTEEVNKLEPEKIVEINCAKDVRPANREEA